MVTRRRFLGMLAALPAMTALAGAALVLPRRPALPDMSAYLAGPDTWYPFPWIDHADPNAWSNRATEPADLTEQSLEDMLKHMREFITHPPSWALQPTKLHVHPDMADLARHVIEHRPGFIERLWWRLTYVP